MSGEEPNGKGTEEQAIQHVHGLLVASLWSTWKDARGASDLDPVKYSRLSVVSLTQVAAMTAVDLGMPIEQFTEVCRANFLEAMARAPRFG